MIPSLLPGNLAMMLRMLILPSGVSATNLSSSTWSFFSLLWMYSPIFCCPGLPSQRGPIATISFVYCQALFGSMRKAMSPPLPPLGARVDEGEGWGEAEEWLDSELTSLGLLE